MAFPDTTLPVTVKAYLDGAWVDLSDRLQGDIGITRGKAAGARQSATGSCRLNLLDDDGALTPLNPISPYYPHVRRGVRFKVEVDDSGGDAFFAMPADLHAYLVTPDVAALDITGDIDIRVDIAPDQWSGIGLCQKYQVSGDQRSWFFFMSNLLPRIRFSSDGTFATVVDRTATAPAPVVDGQRLALRVTVDVNNGAAGHTVTFYTAGTLAGPWTQLGAPVVTAGTTSIHAGTATVRAGDNDTLAVTKASGRLYGMELRNGIGGTAVANPSAASLEPGPDPFTDAAGRAWTLVDSRVVDPDIRFYGVASAYRPRLMPTTDGIHAVQQIDLAGPLRRLEAGQSVLQSAFRRQALDASNAAITKAYWPVEDASDARQIASGMPGVQPMRILGDRNFAGDSTSFPGSAPLLKLAANTGLGPGQIPSHAGTGSIAFRGLFAFPTPLADLTVLVDLWQATGTVRRWRLRYLSGGGLDFSAIGADNAVLANTGPLPFTVDGTASMLGFTVIQDGANVDWHLFSRHVVDDQVVQGGIDGTFNTMTVDRAALLYVAPNGGCTDVTVGHFLVGTNVSLAANIDDGMTGYLFETAAARADRLCGENEVACVIVGDPDDSAQMGPQSVDTLPNLLHECATADGGLLGETRGEEALEVRTRASMYNQTPALTIDLATYRTTSGSSGSVLAPVYDVSGLRNYFTAERTNGSAYADANSASIAADGFFDDSGEYNVATDEQLPGVAGHELRLGTVDEYRNPSLAIDLAANPELIPDWAFTDLGDRVQRLNPPSPHPPGTIDQLLDGYTETLGPKSWTVDANTQPGGPWAVAEVHDPDAGHGYDQRVASDADLVLAVAVDADDTALLVTSLAGGRRWCTPTDDAESSGDFPMLAVVGGEVVTVSDVDPGTTALFGTPVASGWGSPTTSALGASWATSHTSDSSVASGSGRISQGTVNVLRTARVDIGAVNAEVTAETSFTIGTATGAGYSKWVALRSADLSNYYVARLELTTAGVCRLEIAKRVAGSLTGLTAGGTFVTAGTNNASDVWRIWFRVAGQLLIAEAANITTGTASVRVAGHDASLTAGTGLVLGDRLESGNTNTSPVVGTWDNVTVTTPQILTVARSTNGVVKSHAAGAAIDVAEPAYVAR